MLKLPPSLLVVLPGALLSVAGLMSGCDDVHLPAIVPDAGAGAADSSGTGGRNTHSTGGDDETTDKPDCAPPTKECDGACYDLDRSNQHCGSCNHECSGGTSCVSGECLCPPEEKACDGFCVHTATDPQNCGDCGKECSSGVCSFGECEQ